MLYTLKDLDSKKLIGVTDIMLSKIAVELHGAGDSDAATGAAIEWQSLVQESSEPVEFKMNGMDLSIERQGGVQ